MSPILRASYLVVLGLVLFLAAQRGSGPLTHDDLFLHLATGRHVAETGNVPTTDLFSFTRHGERWVSHEWGFGLLTYLSFSLGGYGLLVTLKATLVVAVLGLLYLLMRRAAGASTAALDPWLIALLALALWAIADQIVLRPSLVSSLLMVMLLHLLKWFDDTGSSLSAALIALLFFAWGNLHGEVLFGLFALGSVTVESLLGRWARRAEGAPLLLLQARPERSYLPLLGVSLLLTILNPNGIEVLLYPFRLAWFLFAGPVPLEMGHFSHASPTAAPAFFLLLALLLSGLLPMRKASRLSLGEVMTLGAFLVLSLQSHRFIVYFVLFALPVIARLLSARDDRVSDLLRTLPVRSAMLALTCVAVISALAGVSLESRTRMISRHFPAGAVRFLRHEGFQGRLFNHQNYGGYLRWTLESPIFWDGRNLLFGSLMRELLEMPLEEVTKRWELDGLLITEFEYRQLREQITSPRWALVFWDDFTALYLRRGRFSEHILGRYELQEFPPFGGVDALEARAPDPQMTNAMRQELDQILGFEPDCQRALYFHGLLSFYQGDDERAERELRKALRLGPNRFVYDAMARLLERTGRIDEARRTRARATELQAD